ncbi:hypothetical protein CH29_gp81 [Achromobacter phage JWAlpha]|uniref:Uncharacterized protein n=1 Tax=Achromobacter phage JWAlpha TaxID=1416009 RepID=V9VEL4_9CAUD|nr:hypothetical protein CH29_gp81 [Achromobacter phage JWAlpha]AHC94034.1 hypothetical protein JJJB_0081 [Achromobacter phage JWAlpha]
MSAEPLEIQFARMEERLKTFLDMADRDRDTRANQYEMLREINTVMTGFSHRLANVEASLANSAPTIEEFITIKHKMVGAGFMGKWIWAVAGGLITFIWSARKEIAAWLGGGS